MRQRFREEKQNPFFTKIFPLLLTFSVLLGVLSSCRKIPDPEEAKQEPVTVSLSDYILICPESADAESAMVSMDFLDELKKKCGLDLDWDGDYLRKGEEPAPEAKEILFGPTNRKESGSIRYADYSVGYANGRIVINGGSAGALKKAAGWFLENCVSGTDAILPAVPHTVNETYPKENETLNGIALKDFSVVKSKDSQSVRLYNRLGEIAGISAKSESGHRIVLTASDYLQPEEVAFVSLDDGSFEVRYSSFLNLSVLAVDWFLNQIESGEKTMPEHDTVTVPESALKEIPNVKKALSAYLSAVTDKDPLSYTVGDEIVFSVSLIGDGKVSSCDRFDWLADTDDGHHYKGTASGKYGKTVIRIPATGTGAIRLKVLAKDEKGNLIPNVRQSETMMQPPVFGASVNANEFGQTVAEPSDFDAFWAEQVKKLDNTAPDLLSMEKITDVTGVSYTEGTIPYGNFDFYRIKIQTPSECGYAAGVLSVPKNAVQNSCGITVVFNGYGVEDLTPYAAPGQIVLNVSAHSIELGREAGYYTGLSGGGGELYNYCFRNNDTKESCYFRTMILRDLQAVRFLKRYAGSEGVENGGKKTALGIWNGKLKLYGGSQGAFQGIAVAALDHDVTDAFWWIPWMCDVGGTTGGKLGSTFRPAYTAALRYYDTLSFAKRVSPSVSVSMRIGLGDTVCPLSGTVALYNTLPCAVSCEFKQGVTHGYTPLNCQITLHKKPLNDRRINEYKQIALY